MMITHTCYWNKYPETRKQEKCERTHFYYYSNNYNAYFVQKHKSESDRKETEYKKKVLKPVRTASMVQFKTNQSKKDEVRKKNHP